MTVLEKINEFLNEDINEGTAMFYNHGKSKADRWEKLSVKDAPALLRAVGFGTKRVSLESQGNRANLNKAIKSGKPIYVSFNPFLEKIAGKHELLWFDREDDLVRTYKDLLKEV